MNMNKPYDLTQLRELSDNDEDFIKSTLTMFVERSIETIAEIEKELEVQNYLNIERLAHKIKPSFAYIGMTDLYDEIINIENLAKGKAKVSQIRDLVVNFKERLVKNIHIIEKEELASYE